ncbi:hypothetical protein ENBRE01_0953 [Enteropsectra breve]|nr:hypothetical protein ENBRE01_0953 [Enteropsectra breve]
MDKEEGPLKHSDIIYKLVFLNSHLKKTQIQSITIDDVLRQASSQDESLKKCGLAALAASKLLSKKFKVFLDDCNHVLEVVSKSTGQSVKRMKLPSSRQITLELIDEHLMLNNEELLLSDNFQAKSLDGSVLDPTIRDNTLGMAGPDGFEMEFENLTSVEQGRDGTLIEPSLLMSDREMLGARRRANEDHCTELENDVYRSGLRLTFSIVNKQQAYNPFENYKFTVVMEPKIDSFLKEECSRQQEAEQQREATLVSMQNEFADSFAIEHTSIAENMHDKDYSFNDTINEVESVRNDIAQLSFPDLFEFNQLVTGFNKAEKADCFGRLIQAAASGEVEANQQAAYGSIDCKKVGKF